MADCLFCRIIKKEIPAKMEYEDEDVIAIYDINPQAPYHLLVIPKKHISKISDIEINDISVLGNVIFNARQIAQHHGWQDFRLVFNNGTGAGQTVYHIHLHLLAGRPMTWPPG